IRRLPHRRELPIVAMTANAMASDRERCLAAGMNDQVAKPIDPEELWAKLLQWTRRPAAGTSGDTAPIASPPQTPAEPPDLTGIAGLDAAAGLRRCLGQEGLYRSLLGKFIAGQRDFPLRLAGALAAGDWPTAQRLAHTLKGSAAQIGAMAVRDLAEELERAIVRPEPIAPVLALQQGLSDALLELIEAMAQQLPAAPPPAPQPLDDAQFNALCSRLSAALTVNDFATSHLLDEHEALLHAGLGDAFAGIAEAINEFDFATALERLHAATSRP
uniref:Hpt domain-containing protein n=1 Tax=uncultured Thiodictyon sp. TaxID=1846217 RepID=UPI0025FFE517